MSPSTTRWFSLPRQLLKVLIFKRRLIILQCRPSLEQRSEVRPKIFSAWRYYFSITVDTVAFSQFRYPSPHSKVQHGISFPPHNRFINFLRQGFVVVWSDFKAKNLSFIRSALTVLAIERKKYTKIRYELHCCIHRNYNESHPCVFHCDFSDFLSYLCGRGKTSTRAKVRKGRQGNPWSPNV